MPSALCSSHRWLVSNGTNDFSMIRALALDPGITSGFSIGIVLPECFFVTCDEGTLSGLQLYSKITRLRPDITICESFEYRNRARDNLVLFSRELIGVVKMTAEQGITYLTLQTAAEGKGHFTDDTLRKMRLYDKSHKHGRDALRHLLHWWQFKGGFKFNKGQPIVLVKEDYLVAEGLINWEARSGQESNEPA